MSQTTRNLDPKYYLADILDAKVCDASGAEIGHIVDMPMHLGEKFPRLPGLIIRKRNGKEKCFARREQFSEFGSTTGRGYFKLSVTLDSLPAFSEVPEQVLLRNIWDKQIVDMSDARVVRVNDLQLAEHKGELRLIGVDIGTRGLIRRMGWESWLCPFLDRLKLPAKNEMIAWDVVESIPTDFSHLKLTVASQKIKELHPADLADILDDLSVHEGLNLIRSLDPETAAETLAEADSKTQVQLIEQMSSARASDILEEMEPDEAVDILQDLDDSKAAEILSHMEGEEASDVRELLKHDENTAGGLMSTGYATIFEEFTVAEALTHLRLVALDLEIIYYLYVIDCHERLKGVVSIRDILVSSPETPVTKIMSGKLIFVAADAPQEEVANQISKYNLLALPVLDDKERMLGVVTVDDVMELLLNHMPRIWKRRALSS
ncbi:MAG: magnesium transporter [Candidatus Riflebacteria bacterium]|nr:magnesium transporter [Candidatus Riflebacteria bacterium]